MVESSHRFGPLRAFQTFVQRPLTKDALSVVSGTAAGQVVVFAFSPLITRIYSPEAFGVQGVFLSLVGVLSPAIALRYPMAIIVAENESEAVAVERLSLLIAFGLSVALALVLLVMQQSVLKLVGAEDLGALIWFLPLALFCVAFQDVAGYRAARSGSFRLVGIVTVIQAFITNFGRVLGGLFAPVASVLVAVTSVAPAVHGALLMVQRKQGKTNLGKSSFESLCILAQKHRAFALYRAPADIIDAISQSAPVILLSMYFTPAIAGYYVLARSVVSLPLNIIGSAIGNIYFARLAEMHRGNAHMLPTVVRATIVHIVFLGVPTLLVSFLFPVIFSFVFGESWRVAGEYARWMAIWIAIMLINIPAVRALPIIRMQNVHLVVTSIILFVSVVVLVFGGYFDFSALDTVAMYSAGIAALYSGQIFVYLILIWKHDRKWGT